MKKVDPILVRKFEQLEWFRPTQVLVNLRFVEARLPNNLDDRVRRLRTNKLKECREARDAALFAYGFETQVLNAPVFVAKSEERDYDFVFKWHDGNAQLFYPVQLKELPPDDLNPTVSMDDLYDKLNRYSGTDDLAVAIRLSRTDTMRCEPWPRPKRPNIGALWYFGCSSADQSTWILCGDILKRPVLHQFTYPAGLPDMPN